MWCYAWYDVQNDNIYKALSSHNKRTNKKNTFGVRNIYI